MRWLRRILTLVLLVPWLALSAVIAHEHVHESRSPDQPSVAHSHFAPHTHLDHDIDHLDHDGAEISEADDDDVVWIDEVGLVETPRAFPPPLIVASTPIEMVPEPLVRVTVAADEATLPHGPPRPSLSLRAPPRSFLSDLI